MRYLRFLLIGILALMLGGCAIQSGVLEVVGNDLERTEEIATKYAKPETARCAAYLQEAIGGKQSLLAEDTRGALSLALKAYLLRESTQSGEAAFRAECGDVAAGLLLELGRAIGP